MNTAQGKMELLVLQAKAEQINEADFIADLVNKGLGADVIARLQILSEKVAYIGDQIIKVGKIILMKLWEFIKENPFMSIGIAIGVALTALTSLIVGWIPFLGPILTGITALVIIPTTISMGMSLDKLIEKIKHEERLGDTPLEQLYEGAIKLFSLLGDIFKSVKNELKESK
jgi:ElaB/YqjD/DUF883 family membrane-anchored ribosome-binding protein